MGNAASGNISIVWGLRGPELRGRAPPAPRPPTPSARPAASSSATSCDIVITGGIEAAVTPIGLASFCALKGLSTRNDDPTHASRPSTGPRRLRAGRGRRHLVIEELEHARGPRREDLRRADRLRRQRRRLPHHRPGPRGQRAPSWPCSDALRRRRAQPRATSTTSTPTAPAPNWATWPRPRPSRRPSATTPTTA